MQRPAKSFLFALPAFGGHGTSLAKLSARLRQVGVFALDFIDDDDRMPRYAAMIDAAQPQGAINLFGYGAGGNLAYELARVLEARGREIGLLILLDCVPMHEETDLLSVPYAQMDETAGSVQEQVQVHVVERAHHFRHYLGELRHTGLISAPIHAIVSNTLADDRRVHHWQHHTSQALVRHRATGEHHGAMCGDAGVANAMLVAGIVGEAMALPISNAA